jgi:hypothetical protein
METDGGGWTMVMNINPVDDNLVGYGQDFWTGEHEYGEWDHHFANDYKSPAAYQLNGPDRYNADVPTVQDGEIMIQSVAYPDRETDAAFEDTEIRGWRTWPMLASYPTFQSMFSTECCHGDNCGNGNHPCKTGSPSGQEVGSTDEWDDIIRRGNCLRTDLRYGSSSGGEAFRLMTYDPVSTNDRMGGFGGATNSGNNLCDSQGIFGQRDNSGMDRILCNQDRSTGCGHGESRVMRNPVTGAREPCQQSPSPEYCTTSSPYHYNDPNSFRPGWTSRFFVRENTALTPQVIAAMEACEASGRYYVDGECVDEQPFDYTWDFEDSTMQGFTLDSDNRGRGSPGSPGEQSCPLNDGPRDGCDTAPGGGSHYVMTYSCSGSDDGYQATFSDRTHSFRILDTTTISFQWTAHHTSWVALKDCATGQDLLHLDGDVGSGYPWRTITWSGSDLAPHRDRVAFMSFADAGSGGWQHIQLDTVRVQNSVAAPGQECEGGSGRRNLGAAESHSSYGMNDVDGTGIVIDSNSGDLVLHWQSRLPRSYKITSASIKTVAWYDDDDGDEDDGGDQ